MRAPQPSLRVRHALSMCKAQASEPWQYERCDHQIAAAIHSLLSLSTAGTGSFILDPNTSYSHLLRDRLLRILGSCSICRLDSERRKAFLLLLHMSAAVSLRLLQDHLNIPLDMVSSLSLQLGGSLVFQFEVGALVVELPA